MNRPNGSVAIWCSPAKQVIDASIEAHLNYWRVAGHKRRGSAKNAEDFLEVGVFARGYNSIESINIFIPLAVDKCKIFDLGPRFERPILAQGIFNEILTCSKSASNLGWVDLTSANGMFFCRVHCFAKTTAEQIDQSEVEIDTQSDGTLIRILKRAIINSARSLPFDSALYFRIRIMTGAKDASPFVKIITPADRFFQSGFDEIEYIDFRLNEARTLPDRIDRMMKDDMAIMNVPINLIAFLAAVPVVSELSVSNSAVHKNRLLEDDPWNSYAPHPLPKGMMVYHWKKNDENIENFAAFVKLQTRRTGSKIIFMYLAIAFFFGIFGNLAASYIQAKTGWPAASDSQSTASSNQAGGPTANPQAVETGGQKGPPGQLPASTSKPAPGPAGGQPAARRQP